MQSYKNWFKVFLKRHGFLPLDRWNRFELEHGKKAIFKSNLIKIKKEVDKKSGIYIRKRKENSLYWQSRFVV
jgi:hypothetical protein